MAKITIYILQVSGQDNIRTAAIIRARPDAEVVDFYTNDMDKLLFIAKHRLLPEETILLLDRTKVVGRFVGAKVPTPERLESVLSTLELVI